MRSSRIGITTSQLGLCKMKKDGKKRKHIVLYDCIDADSKNWEGDGASFV